MQKSDDQTPEASFRPSEYTAALVQIILETADQVRGVSSSYWLHAAIGGHPSVFYPAFSSHVMSSQML